MPLSDALEFTAGIDLRPAEAGLTTFARKAASIGDRIGNIAVGAAGAAATVLGTVGTVAGVALASFVDAGMEFETAATKLEVLMGSTSGAKARLDELYTFAATTPFELGDVVNAEVTLRGFGAAAQELMPGLIDFAAATGTDLSQAAIDFGKAWNQGATGLESDAGKILRKQIEIQEGVNATTMSLEDFRAAMLENLNTGMFAGGAARLSTTMAGMLSNLSDEWAKFKKEVADAGLFDNVKGALSIILEMIGENREAIRGVAQLVSTGLWEGFKLVGRGIAATATGVQGLAFGLAGAVGLASDVGQALITATEPFRQTVIQMLDLIGNSAVANGLRSYNAGLGNVKTTLAGLEAGARATAAGLIEGGTALERFDAFTTEAERRASALGTALERTGAAGADVAGGGGGKAGKSAADKEQEDLVKRFEAAQAFQREMTSLTLTSAQQEAATYEERRAQLDAYYAEGLITGEAYHSALAAMTQDFESKLGAIRDEEHEREMQRIREERQARLEYLSTLGGSVADTMSLISNSLEGGTAKQVAAAKKLALAALTINEAQAVGRSIAQYGLPAALPFIALEGASFAIQAANVKKAHQGGILTPDETVRPGGVALQSEAVLNSQATERLVQALNAGGGGGVVELRIGRTSQREVLRGLERGGDMERAVRSVGTSTPGWSGRGAVA